LRRQLEQRHQVGDGGLGRATITNLVSLLELPPEVQDAVRRCELSTGHAKALKGLSDPARQVAVGKEIVARGLSVHATEGYVKQLQAGEKEGGGGDATGEGGGSGRTSPE